MHIFLFDSAHLDLAAYLTYGPWIDFSILVSLKGLTASFLSQLA